MKQVIDEKQSKKSRLVIHIFEVIFSLFLLSWFLLAYIIPEYFIINIIYTPFNYFKHEKSLIAIITFSLSVVMPILALLKIIAICLIRKFPFFSDTSRVLTHLVNIVISLLAIFIICFFMAKEANGSSYFLNISYFTYAMVIISLFYNSSFLVLFIRNINKRNVSYHEYLQFKENTKTEKRKLKISVHMGIQKKIVFSFVLIIFFLIFSLSYIMLQEYRESILNTVLHNGTTLAERSASFVDVNLGDSINIKDYFTQENKSNKVSSFPYNSMTYYGWSKADNTYLATFGTDPDIIGEPISGYLKESLVSGSRYIPGNKTYEFHSPIYMQDKRIGYVVVIYDEVIIYSSYFNTQVRILLFSLFFIYVAIILIYIFGTQITFPILFLGMSVNKLTNNLSHMIKGELAVNREHLNYNDIVKTNDEIKTLSTEIKDMAGVIQGVIPYISSSTFRSVEKGNHSILKEMAFLFTDIRGFTTLCEGMTPDAVVEILNYYLDLQSNIILKHHGDIDKFVGDEIMASFDGEDKELNACLAAIEIRKAMAEDRELKSHIKEKTVSIGIGINTGSVVFGSVGAKERMDYTSIGDTVNLAARLEGANKQYGTKSLISGSVYNQVKDKFLCREIDLMTVKGKKQAVRIYEILQEKSKANKKLLEIKKNFETGLKLYRKKNWDEAESFFNKNLEIFKDFPSEVFLERISLFRKNPPPEKWNGVFNLLVK